MEPTDWGALHPLLVHLPIGLVVGLVVLEGAALLTRSELPRGAVAPVVLLLSLSALATAAAGWLLEESGEYAGELVDRHRTVGLLLTGTSACALLCHAASRRGARPGWIGLYRLALAASLVLLVPAGHWGGSITHGEDWLAGLWPGRAEGEHDVESDDEHDGAVDEGAEPEPRASTYERVVAPILAARCTSCHGPSKQKSGLALHAPEKILAGGWAGPVIAPGDPSAGDPSAGEPSAGELLRRVLLPPDHEDHMPPEEEPQPTPEELRTLEAWIAAGAPFEGPFEDTAPPERAAPGR